MVVINIRYIYIRCILHHWNGNNAILTIFFLLSVSKFVILTTFGAASNENLWKWWHFRFSDRSTKNSRTNNNKTKQNKTVFTFCGVHINLSSAVAAVLTPRYYITYMTHAQSVQISGTKKGSWWKGGFLRCAVVIVCFRICCCVVHWGVAGVGCGFKTSAHTRRNLFENLNPPITKKPTGFRHPDLPRNISLFVLLVSQEIYVMWYIVIVESSCWLQVAWRLFGARASAIPFSPTGYRVQVNINQDIW